MTLQAFTAKEHQGGIIIVPNGRLSRQVMAVSI
jgi:hypothetical protein